MRARVLACAAEIEAAAPRVRRLAATAESALVAHQPEAPILHHRHFRAGASPLRSRWSLPPERGGTDFGSLRGRNVFGIRSWLLDPAWIVVEDGDDLVGFAPLFVHEAILRRGPRVRVLSFPADAQVVYYQDLLVHPARRDEAVGAIFAALDAIVTAHGDAHPGSAGVPPADLIFLGHIPEGSPNLPAIRRALADRRERGWSGFEATNHRRGGVLPWTLPDLEAALGGARDAVDEALRGRIDALIRAAREKEAALASFAGTRAELEAELREIVRRCAAIPAAADHARRIEAAAAAAPILYPYLDLPDRPEAVLEGLAPNARAAYRRQGRRFEEAGGRFEAIDPHAITAADVRDHVALHRARWGASSVVVNDTSAAHHEDLALALARAGVLRLFFARHGGARVASQACFDLGGRRECWSAGRAPEAGPLRAGKLLLLHAVTDAVQRGLAVVDLGYGGFDYKLELTRRSRTVQSFLLGPGPLPDPDALFPGYERIISSG